MARRGRVCEFASDHTAWAKVAFSEDAVILGQVVWTAQRWCRGAYPHQCCHGRLPCCSFKVARSAHLPIGNASLVGTPTLGDGNHSAPRHLNRAGMRKKKFAVQRGASLREVIPHDSLPGQRVPGRRNGSRRSVVVALWTARRPVTNPEVCKRHEHGRRTHSPEIRDRDCGPVATAKSPYHEELLELPHRLPVSLIGIA